MGGVSEEGGLTRVGGVSEEGGLTRVGRSE